MARFARTAVLTWWFFYPWYAGSVVGPFTTKDQCESIRKELMVKTTSCWEAK